MFGIKTPYLVIILLLIISVKISVSQDVKLTNPIFTSETIIGTAESPSWSLDSKDLAFSAWDGSKWSLFIYNLDDDTLIKHSDGYSNERNPVWHPDGVNLVFDRYIDSKPELYTLNYKSKQKSLLFDREINASMASFSSSPNLICFLGFDIVSETWQIYSYDFVYDNLNQLTNHKSSCNSPSFSPDGKHIVYELIKPDTDTCLIMMNWYGNQELIIDSIEASSPSWDSMSWRFSFIGNGNEVYSLRRNGSSMNQITSNKVVEKDFIGSPDGKHAAIIVRKNDDNHLIIVKL